jgi:hypothetical protein
MGLFFTWAVKIGPSRVVDRVIFVNEKNFLVWAAAI